LPEAVGRSAKQVRRKCQSLTRSARMQQEATEASERKEISNAATDEMPQPVGSCEVIGNDLGSKATRLCAPFHHALGVHTPTARPAIISCFPNKKIQSGLFKNEIHLELVVIFRV